MNNLLGSGDDRLYTVSRMITLICYTLIMTSLVIIPISSHAVFNENLGVDTRATSLANTCVADPPGIMSIHYNPAGLSMLDEGQTYFNDLTLPYLRRTGTFTPDPDFKGFMNGYWGNDPLKYPTYYQGRENDPNSDHGGPDPLNNTSGTNSSGRMYIPFYKPVNFVIGSNMGYASREKDSKWTFAFGNYAPYGGGIVEKHSNSPLSFGAKSMYAQHLIYAAPSASLAVSDTFSVGVSVGMGQRAVGASSDMRSPSDMQALTRVLGDATESLEIPVVSEQTYPPPWYGGGVGPYEKFASMNLDVRDDFSPSINLGFLWRPRPWFSYGLCYQSECKAELSGKYSLRYSKQYQRMVKWNGSSPMTVQSAGMLDQPITPVAEQTGTLTMEQVFPMRVQTGVMLRPIDNLKLLFDIQYANWAAVEEKDVARFDQRIQLLRMAKMVGYMYDAYTFVVERNMRDTWHWSIGAEYELNDKLTLRCGYERRPSSLQKDLMDTSYFIPDANLFGIGLGIKYPDGVNFNIALGWLTAHNFTVPNNTSTNLNSLDFTQTGSMYPGLDYHQDLDICMLQFSWTMPMDVHRKEGEDQMEMIHKGYEKIKNMFRKINPFDSKGKKDDISDETHESMNRTDDDFNSYIERLTNEYNIDQS